MTRYQHFGAMLRAADKWREKMLAVPHGDDDRRVAVDLFVDAFRLDREPGRFPDETKVFRCQDPGGLLERARADEALDEGHRWLRRASALGGPIHLRIEQAVQMHDEVAHVGVVDRLLRFSLPGSISGGVVGINADDIQFAEIAELDAVQIREPTKYEVEQLSRLALLRHSSRSLLSRSARLAKRFSAAVANRHIRSVSDSRRTAPPNHANSESRSRMRPSNRAG